MGHAISTRRIAAEGGARPPTPPRNPPLPPLPPSPKVSTYTMPFTCNLIRTDEAAPSKKLVAYARREIEDANWGEYLSATMRDAVKEKYSSAKSEYVHLEDWEITLSSSTTQEKDPKGLSYTVYNGVLTWTSVTCPLKRVQEEIDWRIGDRMSMYEIDNDKWHVYIEPGKVAVA